jgi:phosphoglycerate dehydrogenase-like enzyme
MFRRIVCVDRVGLTEEGFQELEHLSDEPVVRHADSPQSNEEIIRRIRGADCVLVSWDTHIHGEVLRLCPEINYIGMCCSLYDERSANVDIVTAKEMGIAVRGIRDYGDEGLVEFILAQLICLFKELGIYQSAPEQEELGGKKLGIVGFGATGQLLARMAAPFGVDVGYYSRTRKPALESQSLRYMDLNSLLSWADIRGIHASSIKTNV